MNTITLITISALFVVVLVTPFFIKTKQIFYIMVGLLTLTITLFMKSSELLQPINSVKNFFLILLILIIANIIYATYYKKVRR